MLKYHNLIVLLVAGPWAMPAAPLWAQKATSRDIDPDPEVERRTFQVADGFEVNLFAADPLLAKPIQMSFDAAGRLWVACSSIYPQIEPGQKANDRILILEDRAGAGRADTISVFADDLLIPTGILPGDGGVYVAANTELLHLSASTGAGKADRRRVVLSGFGTEDAHHMIHSLRWGPDGRLNINQSIYIHSHIETPRGVRHLNGGGVWQFRPETMQLEVFVRGFVNPWGHHFDRWGQSFVTDGAFGEGINYALPGATYTHAPGSTRILHGLNPGSPKHCGLEVLSGRHLPADWQGNLLTNDFRSQRVCRFVLRADGAGYASQEKPELIKTKYIAFRPVDIKMGPDGAIYLADWYNPIIQHGEVDFRDPRRDHTRGRIWRITAKGRPLVKPPQLVGAPTPDLLAALKAPEDWTRQQARRMLQERGAKVLPELSAWARALDAADPEFEHHRLEALWTYQSLDVVEPELLASLLQAKDHRARAAATRVIQEWHARLHNPLDLLAARVADEHPQVRLEAVRALGRIPSTQAAEAAMRVLERPLDKLLDYGLWLTLRELEPSWLPAVQQGTLNFGGNARYLIYALGAVRAPNVVPPLAKLLRSDKFTGEHEEEALLLLAELGGAAELGLVFDRLLSHSVRQSRNHNSPSPPASGGAPQATGRGEGGQHPAFQLKILNALEQSTRRHNVRPEGDLARIAPLVNAEDVALRLAAVRVVGLWRVEALRPKLLEYARAPQSGERLRQAAVDSLVLLGGQASRELLEKLTGSDNPVPVRRLAVAALLSFDLDAAVGRAVEVLAANPESAEATAIFEAILQRKTGAASLATALAGRKLPADVAKLGVRSVRATGREAPALIETLTRAGGLNAAKRALTPQETQELAADVLKNGDPARGEAIYRRQDMACQRCHAVASAGGQLGPDLASIGASAPVDYLIDSLLQPNKAIKDNYQTTVVVTKDGRILSGIRDLSRRSAAEMALRTAEGRIHIPLKDVEETTPGGSLMPEGLTDALTRAEFIDLIRFLSELGKVGPYSVSKARLVRRWQVLEPTPEARRCLAASPLAAAAGNDPALTWSPAYSTVSGDLPIDAVPRIDIGKDSGPIGVVRCQIEISTAGKVKLLLNSAAGLDLWIDGARVEASNEMVLDLKTGMHVLTFAVDFHRLEEALRCTVDDVPGSSARLRIVGGQ